MRNRTEHGFSRLTAISDAGSTPAASTNSPPLPTQCGVRVCVLQISDARSLSLSQPQGVGLHEFNILSRHSVRDF